ncbi:MAG TPA: TonB-dependent receptor, partial [Caulobacteraceae bacterium]|nr:TonB-dependent receptor [Caulobacteraceae bacterium]
WEHFEEDDNRSRTGKQLCHRDEARTHIGSTPVSSIWGGEDVGILRGAMFSQGCKAGSLYDDNAFGTPNGLAIPFIYGVSVLGYMGFGIGSIDGQERSILNLGDPYEGLEQSHDLRTIASFRDPRYQATADLYQLNLEFDLSDALTLYSQTAYNTDEVYSFQDFNRFNTAPVFTDTSQLTPSFFDWRDMAPGGVFCDPQLGCSDTMAGFDISSASAEQFSQEIRLQSNFDGPLNFSAGANYTTFDVLVDYYIMFNIMTAAAMIPPFNFPVNGVYDIGTCASDEFGYSLNFFFFPPNPVPSGSPGAICPYVDPNPVESINGEGHNYFRSKNPYNLESSAAFGEIYWEATDAVKVTAGLRYTNDKKRFVPVPSQVLLAPDIIAGGAVSRGYPELPPIKQEWGEWSGRLGVDWKPVLSFTDETLLYAFYSRGYKGGGANPPKPGFATEEQLRAGLIPEDVLEVFDQQNVPLPILQLTADEYSDIFEPEFVNAFEIGAKNTLLGGAMTFNTTAFYYDYDGYQVSQIRDRTAVNENFDATVWGLEFETLFAPSRNLQIVANLGYLDTKIADGETSIDIMNRTQGDPNYVVTKGWLQLPSNCVVPLHIAELFLQRPDPGIGYYWQLCGGLGGPLGSAQYPPPNDPLFGNTPYSVENYPELNGGAGILADLGGNELPNAPHWTANIGGQYSFDFSPHWKLTLRGDAYWQSQSFHRVYNYEPYDKLHGWYNLNLSAWLEFPQHDMKVEFYVKNVLDKTPITDAFLNSDDTGLTTNVFFLDPRLIGLSIRKGF